MCGICGICFDAPDRPVDSQLLTAMANTLVHRGPDGAGYFTDAGIGLGHRRLSIIDIEGGDQPIFNEDESLVLVFNGEIYNYKELRQDLLKRGHQFRTMSDTEVIVHLYEDFGTDCLLHLNGMFAFALWDRKERTLFLARDRMGEKPLYYSCQNGAFFFASELKSLSRIPEVSKQVDPHAVDDYLSYGYVPAPRTILDGVRKLPPGSYLTWRNGKVEATRYWYADFDTPSQRTATSDIDYIDELQELVSDSIRIRLRSDVRVGAFLSGGIDSSLIVALASSQVSEPLTTFSVSFEDQEFDESRYAKLVSEQYSTDHHEIRMDPIDLSSFPKLVAGFDEPFADPSALPTYLITREASRLLKVCLSGDAGDELFGGYSQYIPEPLQVVLDRVPDRMRRFVLGTIADKIPLQIRGKGWLSRMAATGAERYQLAQGIFSAAERERLWRPEYRKYVDYRVSLFGKHFEATRLDFASTRMEVDQQTYLPDDILVKVDRTSMSNSLEVRVPLLDHRIVEFANRMPVDLKIRNGEQKFALKQMLRNLVPQSIVDRKKRGFGLPLDNWFRGDYRQLTHDLLLSNDAYCHDFLDRSALQTLFDAHVAGKRDLSNRLWAALWLEQWCREFLADGTYHL